MRHHAIGYSIAAVAVAFLVLSTNAQAFQVRQHAAACAASGEGFVSNTRGWTATGAGFLVVDCPMPDSDSLFPQDMRFINVHVFDGTTTAAVSATVHTTFFGINGGSVKTAKMSGGPSNPGFTGDTTLELGFSTSSADFFDFKMVRIFLPPVEGSSRSNFRGIFYAH